MLNQLILNGIVSSVKKSKGIIKSFHLNIARESDHNIIDSPIVTLNEYLSNAVISFLKEGEEVYVSAHIETEVKGGYGTVTTIVADKIIDVATME